MLDFCRMCAEKLECDDIAYPVPTVLFRLRWLVLMYYVVAIIFDLGGVGVEVVEKVLG